MQNHTIYTVSQLNRRVKLFLETELTQIQVQGEISNLTRSAAGHVYFTLKDEQAQVRCAMFRNRQNNHQPTIQTGGQYVVHGTPSLFEARGDYQLIVQKVEESGLGNLFQQFEALKRKLELEGLFRQERKRPLPQFANRIAVVTSPKGAAIQDILSTLAKRYPLAEVFIFPSEVQGKTAANQIISALNQAEAMGGFDVLIIARGGGSVEDLWAFNDEQLARKIASMPMPVVSGVGHETDFTICDFVADVRAPTPTGAATWVTPDQHALLATLAQLELSLNQRMRSLLRQFQAHIHQLEKRLGTPQGRLLQLTQQIDYYHRHLQQAILNVLNKKNQQLSLAAKTLHAISPLATLDRGYALAIYHNHVLMDATQTKPGESIDIRLAKGQLSCMIQTIKE